MMADAKLKHELEDLSMRNFILLLLIPLNGCALVMADATFRKDWMVAMDQTLIEVCSEGRPGCQFMTEYAASEYSDGWLDGQVESGSDVAQKVKNFKEHHKQLYFNNAYQAIGNAASQYARDYNNHDYYNNNKSTYCTSNDIGGTTYTNCY